MTLPKSTGGEVFDDGQRDLPVPRPVHPMPPPSPLGPMPAIGQGKLSPFGIKTPQVFRGVANTLGGGMYRDKSADQIWADLFRRGHAKEQQMPMWGQPTLPPGLDRPHVMPAPLSGAQMLERIFAGEGSQYLNPGTLQALLRMSRGETVPRLSLDTWDV